MLTITLTVTSSDIVFVCFIHIAFSHYCFEFLVLTQVYETSSIHTSDQPAIRLLVQWKLAFDIRTSPYNGHFSLSTGTASIPSPVYIFQPLKFGYSGQMLLFH